MPSAPEPSGLSLNQLQRWFLARLIERHQTAHRAPASVPAPQLPPAALIAPSATLSAEQRMNVYIDQYIWRFFEVSGNEHKGLRALLGQADFEALITDYLSRFPPYGFSLNNLCHALPHYMDHYCDRPDKALLAEMVRLERAVSDAYDTYRVGRVTADDLAAVPGDVWGLLRFRLDPSVRLLACEYDVLAMYDAHLADEPLPERAPRKCWVAVWRADNQVWRQSIGQARYEILSTLAAGAPVGVALERAAEVWEGDVEELAGRLFTWFSEWVKEEFFSSYILPES